jgi:hypothetical protein
VSYEKTSEGDAVKAADAITSHVSGLWESNGKHLNAAALWDFVRDAVRVALADTKERCARRVERLICGSVTEIVGQNDDTVDVVEEANRLFRQAAADIRALD